ncbi:MULTISPECIES: globin [unclassified Luteimonas]|uniref:globin n=1 Tax=unclassified Luteimonas TaxID=2629088 RepID=UPI0016024C94|nr:MULTISPECIES: globin [unclassified Luteimonas]MBB1472520.1 globin [Luteimonas sp. MC1782]MBB6598760.1 globin [Luteimonas sp. MC1825]QOC88921.1 globin [Luteimonas sp. MC1825]
MSAADPYADLHQSYGRCLRDKDFIGRFYDVFLASNPDVPPMFAHTDFSKQRMALRRGITMAIFHAGGSAVVERGINEMGAVHASHGRCPVPVGMYEGWIDSLLQVVADTDPEADAALMARWRQAMGVVIATFRARDTAGAAPVPAPAAGLFARVVQGLRGAH